MTLHAKLNAAQRQAVLHDSGPLIVLAGPGTGKTSVIIHRIAELIVERHADPTSILAVTFTIKAAEEMRGRLAETLQSVDPLRGVSLAQAVRVHTFHALGMSLLRRFGDVLGMPPRLEMIDDVQQRRVMCELMDRHALFPHAHARGRETVVEHAQSVFEKLANHAVEPARAIAAAAQWRQQIEADRNLDAVARAGAFARCELFDHAARMYELFTAECQRRGWLTFADLISIPIRLLRNEPQVAAIVRSELRHLVVDEFQDLNAAQIEFLRLLMPPDPRADLCIVGDDDQAIYGFRGADDRAFEKFAALYPQRHLIRLEENYRSGQRIIDVGNAIIAKAGRRFDPKKVIRRGERKLKPGEAPPDPVGSVECVRLEKDPHAGDVIAAVIKADRAASSDDRPWSRYAVVARTHTQLDRVTAALEIEGIPVRRVRRKSIMADAGVRVVVAWVNALLEPRDWTGVRELILRGPVALPAALLLTLEKRYAATVSRFDAAEEGVEHPGDYMPWLAAQPEANEHLKAADQELSSLRASLPVMGAGEMIKEIVQRSQIAHAEMLDARGRAKRVSALVALLRWISTREPRLSPPGDLATLWREYGGELISGDAIDDGDGVENDEFLDQAAPEEGAPVDAVMLLTAHSAKGLEFDVVFTPGVSPTARWPSAPKADESHITIPPGLCGEARTPEATLNETRDEERRLFYVACTRARNRLVVLAQANKGRSKGVNFFEELSLDQPGCRLVAVHEAAPLMDKLAASMRGDLDRELRDWKKASTRRQLILKMKREIRESAARALDSVDAPVIDEATLARAQHELNLASVRLAMIGPLTGAGPAPHWLARAAANVGQPQLTAEYAAHAARLKEAKVGEQLSVQQLFATPGLAFTALTPPLKLSFTQIDRYLRCPMCYFLTSILRLPEPERDVQQVGTLTHRALEQFYRQWTHADAEGLPKPGLPVLESIARQLFFAAVEPGVPVDKDVLNQLLGQLRLLFANLHDDRAHVLEIERAWSIPFVHNGITHTITGKIDRIDHTSQGYRIIDYKTGQSWKRLKQPEKNDLQLGLYARALDHLYPDDRGPSEHVPGTAEYWLLATGERGVIDLSHVDHSSVSTVINKVIEGMLAGDWSRDGDCKGACRLLMKSVEARL